MDLKLPSNGSWGLHLVQESLVLSSTLKAQLAVDITVMGTEEYFSLQEPSGTSNFVPGADPAQGLGERKLQLRDAHLCHTQLQVLAQYSRGWSPGCTVVEGQCTDPWGLAAH